jgi:hypothetical protein
VRVSIQVNVGWCQFGSFECFTDPNPARGPVSDAMDDQRFTYRVENGEVGIEALVGVLEDHLDFFGEVLSRSPFDSHNILPIKSDPP